MNVEWSEHATAQLEAIRGFLARTSPGYAAGLIELIVARSERLADRPLMGATVPEYDDDEIREVFEHPYRIIYRAAKDRILVVAVVHAARSLPRRPPA